MDFFFSLNILEDYLQEIRKDHVDTEVIVDSQDEKHDKFLLDVVFQLINDDHIQEGRLASVLDATSAFLGLFQNDDDNLKEDKWVQVRNCYQFITSLTVGH